MMKKLSKINESFIDDVISRARDKSIVRKEDETSNIRKLKPIDIGCSVLWANEDYKRYDNCFFDFTEAKTEEEETKSNGWRLPTLEEVSELITKSELLSDDDFHLKNNDNELIFNRIGFIYRITKKITDKDDYYCWTSTQNDLVSHHILTIDDNHILCSNINSKNMMDQVIQNDSDKLCIRLVKDK